MKILFVNRQRECHMKRFFFFLTLILSFGGIFFTFPLNASSPVAVLPYKTTSPLIVLDAGHGGGDLGAEIKYPRCIEKRMTLAVALLAKKQLNQMGYRVILTRSSDTFVPLMRRVYMANSAHAGLFVSVHFNSCPNPTPSGIEVFYNPAFEQKAKMDASKKLAYYVLRKTAYKTGFKSRGVKKAGYLVIRETHMPAVLIECGFLTNPIERDHIRNREYIEKLATGIAEGIDRFMRS
jgi:N-acetylmuramoyl-L-alanine amidase